MSRASDLASENKEIYEWIRDNGHLEFVTLANECDNYARGDQWDSKVKAKMARRRKPYLAINRVLATCATLLGEYFERRGDVSFRPQSAKTTDVAKILDKLWLNFTHSQNYDWVEMLMFFEGIIRSRGFVDLRIDFDHSMRGEPVISIINSKDVGLYPGDSGMDPDKWTGVLLTKWLAPRDIAEIFKVSVKDVMMFGGSYEMDTDFLHWRRDSFGTPLHDQQIISDDQRQKNMMLRVLERQEWEYKTVDCFVDIPTGEVMEIPDVWENDREKIQLAMVQHGYGLVRRKVKKINWVTTVGDMLLHSSISPYKHFTVIPYFPFVIGGKPVGIVEQLRDPQNLLNKTLSQELHIVAGVANSGFKVKKGSLANMTLEQLEERGGEDGIVIEVNTNTSDVEKIQPNQVPTGLDRLSYKASEAIQQISLVNDSLQGLNRADEAGKAIEAKAIRGSSALSPIYAALDQTRRLVARNWLDLTQQFVTEERAYYIAGPANTSEQEEVVVNQQQFDGSFLNDLTVGEYAVNITNVVARDSFEQNQFDILMQMIREGAPIPWSEAVNSLTILDNRKEIVQYLKQQEGRTDPTEEDMQRAELEKRLMEAEALDKESSAQVKMAQAQKAQVLASKEVQPDNSQQMEAMKAEHDARMKHEDMLMKQEQSLESMRINAETARQKLEYERERNEEEMRFLREKHELELEKLRASIEAVVMKAEIKEEQKNAGPSSGEQTESS